MKVRNQLFQLPYHEYKTEFKAYQLDQLKLLKLDVPMPTAATHNQHGAKAMQGRLESTEYSTHSKKYEYEDICSEGHFTRIFSAMK